MPRYLKLDTEQRLTVSQEILSRALGMLAVPKPVGYPTEQTDYAIEAGMIGAAADLAISACLHQLLGRSATLRESGYFLNASEALASFRKELASQSERLAILTEGVTDGAAHLRALDKACTGFPLIFTARALGLHAGRGTSRDIAYCHAKTVADFLSLLAKGSKWKSYLKKIPALPEPLKDRTLLAQELRVALEAAGTSPTDGDYRAAVVNLSLILPEIPEEEPEWLSALNRVNVAPSQKDLSILVRSLTSAKVGEFIKVGKGVAATPVRFDPKNPDAITVRATTMSQKFTDVYDQWSGFRGNANSALDKGRLELPSINTLYEYVTIGVEGLGIPKEEIQNGLSAQSVWPFIAAALMYAGVEGPCFYIASAAAPSANGEIVKQLRTAGDLHAKIRKRLGVYEAALTASIQKSSISGTDAFFGSIKDSILKRRKANESLLDALKRRTKAALIKDYSNLIESVESGAGISQAIDFLQLGLVDLGTEGNPVMALLIESTIERDDLKALQELLKDKTQSPNHTAIRKAIRDIDYLSWGPKQEN